MRIIYIGKGCIYSPFLIKRPQPQRSYLDNVSQYTGLKPATTLRACMPRLTLSLLSTGEIVIISPNCQQAFPTEFQVGSDKFKVLHAARNRFDRNRSAATQACKMRNLYCTYHRRTLCLRSLAYARIKSETICS